MTAKKNIVVFGASNNILSINQSFAQCAALHLLKALEGAADLQTLDLNAYEMPIYSPMREQKEGIPQQAHAFFNRLGAADAIIVSFAEYNGSFSPAYKNILDWSSRIDRAVYHNKPCLFLATSPGGRGGQMVLDAACATHPHLGANICASFFMGPFSQHFDSETQRLMTPDLKAKMEDAIGRLVQALG